MVTSAWLYDGETALRRSVEIGVAGRMIEIVGEDGSRTRLSPGLLAFAEDRGHELVYARSDRPGWRLGMTLPVPGDLADLLPARSRYGHWIDRVGLGRASVIGIAASAAVMFVVYSLPHFAAPYVPDSVMKRYGDAMVGDFGGKFCAGPGGQQAIDKLVRRLAPEQRGLNVRVVNIPVVNAAALPGGNIVVFSELLSEAGSADEFAGVLGHEIAHVEHRDIAEAMVRELGLGLVVSTIGGDVGGQIHKLAALSYSRDAESKADDEAIAALQAANISPAPTARFFERLAKTEAVIGSGDVLVYLSSHPISKERGVRFRTAAKAQHYQPALSRDEWDALVDICHNDPKQQAADDGNGDFKIWD